MPGPIRVGLWTHAEGAHVGAYLAALAAAPGCGEVTLVDPDGRWAAEARRVLKDKLAGVGPDYRQSLAKRAPQLALITVEARRAPPLIAAALEADCHVFAEKPACVRIADFAPLVQQADAKHRYLMLALANRTNPEVRAARDLVRQGRIGKLFGVELQLVADQTRLTRPAYQRQWFADRDRAGGGHLIWLGIHWLDLAMHITGESIVEVAGFTANVGDQPIQVEDAATAALRFNSGALGTITSGYYLDRGYHSHIKVWGSRGWLLLEPQKDRPLTVYAHGQSNAAGEPVTDVPREPRGYGPFVAAAVDACAAMSEPPISSGESLRALRTVFAIYDSARTGRATRMD